MENFKPEMCNVCKAHEERMENMEAKIETLESITTSIKNTVIYGSVFCGVVSLIFGIVVTGVTLGSKWGWF